MKLRKLLALIMVCMLALTGCNNSKKYDEYMQNGEKAVKQERYEDALEYFDQALVEKEDDKEASSLYKQVEQLLQVKAKMKHKLYDEAIDLCEEIMDSDSQSSVCRDAAKSLKAECEKLNKQQENLSFKEQIEQKISEVKELMAEKEYMNAKVKLGYIIDELTGKSDYINELKECNELLKTCNDKIDEMSKKEESDNSQKSNSSDKKDYDNDKIDFNDDLKKQIANAGSAYVEFYFEYASGTAPSKFAEQAFEDTENDTPLGQYKEQGRTIFMNAFKQAFEATGNEYY
ncbi:hypothetical protein [Intestinibacter sp.]